MHSLCHAPDYLSSLCAFILISPQTMNRFDVLSRDVGSHRFTDEGQDLFLTFSWSLLCLLPISAPAVVAVRNPLDSQFVPHCGEPYIRQLTSIRHLPTSWPLWPLSSACHYPLAKRRDQHEARLQSVIALISHYPLHSFSISSALWSLLACDPRAWPGRESTGEMTSIDVAKDPSVGLLL